MCPALRTCRESLSIARAVPDLAGTGHPSFQALSHLMPVTAEAVLIAYIRAEYMC